MKEQLIKKAQELAKELDRLHYTRMYERIDEDLYEQMQNEYDRLVEQIEELDKQPIKASVVECGDEEIEEDEGRTHQILPTHKDVLRNTTSKEFNFLSNLISVSNFNNIEERKGVDMECYLYEKDLQTKLNELKEQGVKIPSRNTIKKHMQTLSQIEIGDKGFKLMNISNSPNGIVYHIAQSYDKKYFQSIPIKQFNELVTFTNNNVLKLYCIFKYTIENENKKRNTDNDWVRIDRYHLCRHMGLKDTRGNCDNLSIAIKGLKKLGYIKIKQEDIIELDEEGNRVPKTVKYYKLTTYEEWLNKE